MPKSNFRSKIRIRRQILIPEGAEIHKTNNGLTERKLSIRVVFPAPCHHISQSTARHSHSRDPHCLTIRLYDSLRDFTLSENFKKKSSRDDFFKTVETRLKFTLKSLYFWNRASMVLKKMSRPDFFCEFSNFTISQYGASANPPTLSSAPRDASSGIPYQISQQWSTACYSSD